MNLELANELLKKELIKECEEHQQAMLYAGKKIKVLEKALELACLEFVEIYRWHTVEELKDELLEMARKELDNENKN